MNRRQGRWRHQMVLAWLLVCGVTVPTAVAGTTEGFDAIQRTFLREEFRQVITLAHQFLAVHPDAIESARVWMWLAISLDRAQRTNEALRELDRLKTRLAPEHPDWAEAMFWEGDISRRALQMVRAKLAYERLLEEHDQSIWAAQTRLGLGLIHLHQQGYEAAIQYLHDVQTHHADTPAAKDAQLFEGLCRLRLEQYGPAVRVLEGLLQGLRDPAMRAQAGFYLGESLTGQSRYDEAISAYVRATAADPRSPWAHVAEFGLGWVYYQSDRCRESLASFERYLGLGIAEYRYEALFAQGSCMLRLGRTGAAIRRFDRILKERPKTELAVQSGLALVDLYQAEGELKRAHRLVQQLRRWPLDESTRAKVRLRHGMLALAQGEAEEARSAFERVAEHEDVSMRQSALTGLGDVEMFLGEAGAAQERYRDAVELDPAGPPGLYATYQIGRIVLQRGKHAEAIEIFEDIIEHSDTALADDARLALALTQFLARKEDAAREALDDIREAQPESAVAARAAYYLALIALGENDEAAVRTLAHEAMTRAPHSGEAMDARLLLADLLAQRTSPEDAAQWLEQSYKAKGLSLRHRGKLAKRLGELARQQDRCPEALTWYDQARKFLPSMRGEVQYRMASCYEQIGNITAALEQYDVIEQPPWSIRGQLALGKLLEREGKLEDASAVYESLARQPIPEADLVRERLAALRSELQLKE